MKTVNEQSEFWRGEFSDGYISRNDSPELLLANQRFFEMALLATRHLKPARVIEFGANIGMNIRALQGLDAFRDTAFTAVEIKESACDRLREIGVTAHNADILAEERGWGGDYDLVLVKGLLIHIHPNELRNAYAAIYDAARQFIFIAEYFATERRPVTYRGHPDRLWLADYGGELMDQYPDLVCLDYGFAWKRDRVAPQNDITWWLLEKPWRP